MIYAPEKKAAMVDHVLIELEKKRSLTAICEEDEAAPSMAAFLAWVAKDATLAERYANAREAQITKLIEEVIGIADDATDDAYISTDQNGKQYARIDGDSIKRASLRIDARERFAKMMLPTKFGTQRMDVTSGGKALPAPVMQSDNRIQALLVLAAHRASQLAEPVLLDANPDPLSDIMD